MRRLVQFIALGAMFACISPSCTARQEGIVQPYAASSNSAVTQQVVLGDTESRSSIRYIDVTVEGAVYFAGGIDGYWSLGQIDMGDDVLWRQRLDYSVSGLRAFNASLAEGGSAVATISNGTSRNGDEHLHGIIDIYDQDGAILIHGTLEDPEYNIQLFGLQIVYGAPVSPVFFVAGGAERGDVVYPFCALVRAESDSSLYLIKSKIFLDRPNEYFLEASWNSNESSPRFFTSSMSSFSECGHWNLPATEECRSDIVVCIDDSLHAAWSCSIPSGTASKSDVIAIQYYDGAIYAVGVATVTKPDGYQWDAGLIASISESGAVNWSKSIVLSDYWDSYYGMDIHEGILYAAGICASKVNNATDRCYGYAAISKFELPSGELIGHSSFGGSRFASKFYQIRISSGLAICGGWTNYYLAEYGVQAWIAEIDLSSLSSSRRPLALEEPTGGAPSRHPLPSGWR